MDRSHTSQKTLVQAIASGLSTGKVATIDRMDESILTNQIGNGNINIEVVLADMKFEAEYVHNLEFEWVAENGISEAFERVRSEYVLARNLRPLRIFVHGPPASGKTYYSEKLAKQYYLSHIKIGDIINEALNRNDEWSEKMKKSLADQANAKTKAKKKALQQQQQSISTKAGSSSKKKQQQLLKEYDTPRIPPTLLTKIVKLKLRSPSCRNKGFILDGFPRYSNHFFDKKKQK